MDALPVLPGSRAKEDTDGEMKMMELPTVTEVIESFGVGWAQVRTTFVAGAIWLADGAELLLISSVTEAVAQEWEMSTFQQSFVVSLVFIGVMIGNAVGGPFSDSHGRRVPLLTSFVCIVVFSILSACSWGFVSLGIIRLLVGISFGIGQPASMTLVNEITPTSGRILMNCIVMSMFTIGECYSGLLLLCDDRNLHHLHWRSLLVLGAVPSLVFGVLAYFCLYQSPLYLSCCGNQRDTRVVLHSIRRENRVEHLPVEFRPSTTSPEEEEAPMLQQLSVIIGPELFGTTTILAFSCFVLNLVFYGCLYSFPQIMTEVDFGGSPAVNLITGALWELVGYLIAFTVGSSMKRIPVMKVYLCLTAASLVAFAIGAPRVGPDSSWIWSLLLFAGYYGIKFFPSIGFIVVYVYASEVYPTVARSSGTALVIACGRIASILAPIVYEAVVTSTGSFVVFFWAITCLCAINLGFVFGLPIETAGRLLQDRLEPASAEKCPEYGATGSTRA